MKKFNIPPGEFEVNVKKPNAKSNASETSSTVDILISNLIEDEENEKLCGEITQESIDSLALDIKHDGFKGSILAYPIEDGLYRIESGHKRVRAAKKAGLTKLPVIITKPPKTDSERRYRLISMNLHTRENPKPTDTARRAAALIESIIDIKKENGESIGIMEAQSIAAKQLECSEKSIEKYRQLIKLTASLQKLADDGVSWSALTSASSLPADKQDLLATFINNEVASAGVENISRPWIIKRIQNMRNQMIEEETVMPRVSVKRRDGAKLISKCAKEFEDIIGGNVIIHEKNKKEAIENLKNIRAAIDKKLAELDVEE